MNSKRILPRNIVAVKKAVYSGIAALALAFPNYAVSSEIAPAPKGAYSSPVDNQKINYSQHNEEYHKRESRQKWHPGYMVSRMNEKRLEVMANYLTRPIPMELSPIKSRNEEQRKRDNYCH